MLFKRNGFTSAIILLLAGVVLAQTENDGDTTTDPVVDDGTTADETAADEGTVVDDEATVDDDTAAAEDGAADDDTAAAEDGAEAGDEAGDEAGEEAVEEPVVVGGLYETCFKNLDSWVGFNSDDREAFPI